MLLAKVHCLLRLLVGFGSFPYILSLLSHNKAICRHASNLLFGFRGGLFSFGGRTVELLARKYRYLHKHDFPFDITKCREDGRRILKRFLVTYVRSPIWRSQSFTSQYTKGAHNIRSYEKEYLIYLLL